MPRNTEKPFHKILMTGTKLRLYVEHGDLALDGQTPQQFAADVLECFEHLMTFRNIVNGMVSFNEPPAEAARMYLPEPGE
jgi:hypothetical protein